MTKKDVIKKITDTAEKYGFKASENACFMMMPTIMSEELNFNIHIDTTEDTDWQARRVGYRVRYSASVRKMGGNPAPEELLKTAEEIQSGAELIMALDRCKLEFTETF